MREVGVHLEEIVVSARQPPLEAVDVGGPESQLAGTLLDEEAAFEFGNQRPHDVRRAVRRIVVYD